MPAIYRYTVSKHIKVQVTAENPDQAVQLASEIPPEKWENTDVSADKDF